MAVVHYSSDGKGGGIAGLVSSGYNSNAEVHVDLPVMDVTVLVWRDYDIGPGFIEQEMRKEGVIGYLVDPAGPLFF
jgi:ATP phosphoribosyltransferase